jgi:hypothetical protein
MRAKFMARINFLPTSSTKKPFIVKALAIYRDDNGA